MFIVYQFVWNKQQIVNENMNLIVYYYFFVSFFFFFIFVLAIATPLDSLIWNYFNVIDDFHSYDCTIKCERRV